VGFYSVGPVVTVKRGASVSAQGDMGGQRTLQRKWTTFLKARLDCSLPEPSLPPIVQDVFLLKDEQDWRKSVFYAVFTPQSYVLRFVEILDFYCLLEGQGHCGQLENGVYIHTILGKMKALKNIVNFLNFIMSIYAIYESI